MGLGYMSGKASAGNYRYQKVQALSTAGGSISILVKPINRKAELERWGYAALRRGRANPKTVGAIANKAE